MAASSKTACSEKHANIRDPVSPVAACGVMIAGKIVHPYLLRVGTGACLLQSPGPQIPQQQCLHDR